MYENKQTENPRDQNVASTTSQLDGNTASTSTGTILPKAEYDTTISPQPQPTASTGINPNLARALVGGLIGATLGTLAGAIAGKRTSQGVNHAAKGVGEAFKTIAGGVNQTAKGVGEAVKSVGEGVGHAVIGTTLDATNAVAETVKPAIKGASDAVKSVGEGVNQAVKSATDAAKDTADNAKQSTVAALDAAKSAVEDVKKSDDDQNFKLAKERMVAEKPFTTDEITSTVYVQPQTTNVAFPAADKEGMMLDQISYVNPSTADFQEGESAIEIYQETGESESKFSA